MIHKFLKRNAKKFVMVKYTMRIKVLLIAVCLLTVTSLYGNTQEEVRQELWM